MNAPTTKPKAAQTVEQALDELDAQRKSNLRIWRSLGKTDPAHTKQFKRAGGFSGTAIKPIWITQRLTELFGPCGEGWGMDKPDFTTVHGQDGEVLVYCTVAGWYCDGKQKAVVYGVGGDKAVSWVGRGNDRRMVCDDEAFKKAFTDALGNAFKFVGVGADVHMGLFDDSKYVREVAAEFHPPEPKKDSDGSDAVVPRGEGDMSDSALRGCLKALTHNLHGVATVADLDELLELDETKAAIEQCKRRFPHWWEQVPGKQMPDGFVPLRRLIAETRQGLVALEMENAR